CENTPDHEYCFRSFWSAGATPRGCTPAPNACTTDTNRTADDNDSLAPCSPDRPSPPRVAVPGAGIELQNRRVYEFRFRAFPRLRLRRLCSLAIPHRFHNRTSAY